MSKDALITRVQHKFHSFLIISLIFVSTITFTDHLMVIHYLNLLINSYNLNQLINYFNLIKNMVPSESSRILMCHASLCFRSIRLGGAARMFQIGTKIQICAQMCNHWIFPKKFKKAQNFVSNQWAQKC